MCIFILGPLSGSSALSHEIFWCPPMLLVCSCQHSPRYTVLNNKTTNDVNNFALPVHLTTLHIIKSATA